MYFDKIRYYIIFKIIRVLSPALYKQIVNLNIEGLLTLKCSFIRKIPRPSIIFMKEYFNKRRIKGVEIGVARGYNSRSILKELNIQKLYLIDIWDDSKIYFIRKGNYKTVLRRFGNNPTIKIIKDYSKNILKYINEDLDFAYIDGDHSFEGCLSDLEKCYHLVKDEGIIAGHDILNIKSVYNALVYFCNKYKLVYEIHPPDFYIIKKR